MYLGGKTNTINLLEILSSNSSRTFTCIIAQIKRFSCFKFQVPNHIDHDHQLLREAPTFVLHREYMSGCCERTAKRDHAVPNPNQ